MGQKDMRPPPKMKLPNLGLKNDWNALVTEELEHSCESLKSERLDLKLLAMDSLLKVTSPPNIHCKSIAASKIFSGPILDHLLDLIQCEKTEEANKCELDSNHRCMMRRKALKIFANCLECSEDMVILAKFYVEKIPFIAMEFCMH